ncbi:hypothetical protein CMV_011633 [Castanea mollissima]|uniref:Uncharacterized protein n=1 Tax=Castanea mollissima TaxID=60419 RepID=A0A8J4VNM6_9ROSI|nr:hypothetical protein CMV_011633 [Castanea mollissima]
MWVATNYMVSPLFEDKNLLRWSLMLYKTLKENHKQHIQLKELPDDILNVVQLHWTSPILNASVDVVQGGRSVEMRAVGVNKGCSN